MDSELAGRLMKIARTRKAVVNLGDYNSFQFGASVEVEDLDLGHDPKSASYDPDKVAEEMAEFCDDVIDRLITDDIKNSGLTRAQRNELLETFTRTRKD